MGGPRTEATLSILLLTAGVLVGARTGLLEAVRGMHSPKSAFLLTKSKNWNSIFSLNAKCLIAGPRSSSGKGFTGKPLRQRKIWGTAQRGVRFILVTWWPKVVSKPVIPPPESEKPARAYHVSPKSSSEAAESTYVKFVPWSVSRGGKTLNLVERLRLPSLCDFSGAVPMLSARLGVFAAFSSIFFCAKYLKGILAR